MKSSKTDLIYDSLAQGFQFEAMGDLQGSIRAFSVAAKLGNTDAQSMLGTILGDRISPTRPHEAVYWYKRGVRGGDSRCAWNLAMHYNGLGKIRWYSYWLNVAAEMGDEDAVDELVTGKWWNKRNKA